MEGKKKVVSKGKTKEKGGGFEKTTKRVGLSGEERRKERGRKNVEERTNDKEGGGVRARGIRWEKPCPR